MSSKEFSNTSTGDAPADPYKAKNKDDPSLEEKIETLNNFVSYCKFGMMTTHNVSSNLLVSRCMAVAAKEGGGIDLLFHTNTESGKTDDLTDDPSINISFLNATGEWASISGSSSILTDRETVKKYYSPQLRAWVGDLGDGKHDGGPDDPRIGVIKVEAKTITYAVTRGNVVSRGVEMVQGALTGSTAQVNKLREISEDECKQWRASHQ
ncbi:hypothetical protein GJ744_011960 [Endocarpon pusillum]|uniref:General stress protein FMN-binding split barrel domain-containing protein n=1 Tax=Endocarpon pusillum TaxID=364733 RepID=A0A8H7ATV7_9EURO|nr:hypothetical protein GJ744_011960 [Endocarpon pusillum]